MHFYKTQKIYGPEFAFQDLPTATTIFSGLILSVHPSTRGLGLGKELVTRTNQMAKNRGCSHVYVEATGMYSQAIFKKLNFQVLHETQYEGVKHKDGSELFKDTREHKVHQIIALDLSQIEYCN